MTRGRWIAAVVALLFVSLGAAWFTGLIGPDRRIFEIRDLQARLGDQSLTDEQRRALWGELRTKMEELPEELRFKAMQPPGGQQGMGRGPQLQHLKDVLAMSDKDRNAALDKEIDAELARRKQWEDRAKNGQGPPNGPPADNTKKPDDSNKPGGPGGRGPGGPGGGFGRPTDAQMSQWRNRMLSSVPADARATFGTYRQLMQARAIQRGTPLPQGGPGPGPR